MYAGESNTTLKGNRSGNLVMALMHKVCQPSRHLAVVHVRLHVYEDRDRDATIGHQVSCLLLL